MLDEGRGGEGRWLSSRDAKNAKHLVATAEASEAGRCHLQKQVNSLPEEEVVSLPRDLVWPNRPCQTAEKNRIIAPLPGGA